MNISQPITPRTYYPAGTCLPVNSNQRNQRCMTMPETKVQC